MPQHLSGLFAGAKRNDNHVQFLPERGAAICFGETEQEAENTRAVLEKNARAARIAEITKADPIPIEAAKEMRKNYLQNYSKLA